MDIVFAMISSGDAGEMTAACTECALGRRIQIDHEAGVYSQLISPSPGSLTKKSTPSDDRTERINNPRHEQRAVTVEWVKGGRACQLESESFSILFNFPPAALNMNHMEHTGIFDINVP